MAEGNKVKVKDNSKTNVDYKKSKTIYAGCNKPNEKLIITVISNKGGVGKTSIAVAFSMYCAEKIGGKTLLLELDSSPGDFGSLFDIGTNKTLELALKFPKKYKSYVKNIYKNLDVLKGIPDPLIAEGIKKGAICKLLEHICRDYKFIIADSQTVINGMLIDVLKISNTIFVISDYCLESISRISNLVDVLVNKFSISKSNVKIIINKKKLFCFLRCGDISKIIDFPIEAFISLDRKFDKSVFLFNKRKIFGTRFFKDASKALDKYKHNWS